METGKALALEDKDSLSRPGQGGAGGAAAGAAADDDCVVRHHCCLGLANGENARMQCKGIRARRDEGRIPGVRARRARAGAVYPARRLLQALYDGGDVVPDHPLIGAFLPVPKPSA